MSLRIGFVVTLFSVLCLPVLARAGNVDASQRGSSLEIRGDDRGAHFDLIGHEEGLTEAVQGLVRLVPTNGTTANGLGEQLRFEGVEKVSISLGAGKNVVSAETLLVSSIATRSRGDQTLTLTGVTALGGVRIREGNGALEFFCVDSPIGDLSVRGGPQADEVTVGRDLRGETRLSLGEGDNHVAIANLDFGSISVTTGAGNDSVELDNFDIAVVKLDLGGGSNTAVFKSHPLGTSGATRFRYRGGSGPDFLDVPQRYSGRDMRLELGNGANAIGLHETRLRRLTCRGGAQEDSLLLRDVDVFGRVNLDLGGGANSVTGQDDGFRVHDGDLSYRGGAGDDLLLFVPVNVEGKATFSLGAGVNSIGINGGSDISESLRISGGSGDDTLQLSEAHVGQGTKLTMGNGDNSLVLHELDVGGDLLVTAGSGDDAVTFDDPVNVSGTQTIRLGKGINTGP